LKYITRFVEEKGGLEHCNEIMSELALKAKTIIYGFPSCDAATALKETVDYTIHRNN
jgi:geranylgeranyl pyrophosphate synthase